MEADEVESEVKCGSLYLPPQGFLKQKKSWHRKYFALYKASRQGIQRLEVFDSEDQFLKQNANKIIALTECLKVSPNPQKQQPNVFEIRTKDSVHLFSADTFHEMNEWLNCLQLVAFGNRANCSSINKYFDSNSNLTSNSNANHLNNSNNSGNNSSTNSVISFNNLPDNKNEENLLYCSVDAPEVYQIKIIDTDASLRCGLKANNDKYTLIITTVSISLTDDNRIIFTWPYRHIRRYGCTKDGFSLEAGRKCASGQGLFSFTTKEDGNLIFQAVATHVNSLKTTRNLTDDCTPNNNNNNNNSNSNISNNNSTSNNNNNNNVGNNVDSFQVKQHNETFSTQNLFHFNNETKPFTTTISSSSSSSFSSLLSNAIVRSRNSNSTSQINKITPEPTKRHTIQPAKSPVLIQKIRVNSSNLSITNNSINPITTTISTCSTLTDINQKHLPPINKPPRKSKESSKIVTDNDNEEPVFASREEIFGLPPEINHYETAGNCADYDDNIIEETVYDVPGQVISQSSLTKVDQSVDSKTLSSSSSSSTSPSSSSSSFCPTPVSQSVSKLTSVLKMMFTGGSSQQITAPKYNYNPEKVLKSEKDKGIYKCTSSSNSSIGPPIVATHEKVITREKITTHEKLTRETPEDKNSYAKICPIEIKSINQPINNKQKTQTSSTSSSVSVSSTSSSSSSSSSPTSVSASSTSQISKSKSLDFNQYGKIGNKSLSPTFQYNHDYVNLPLKSERITNDRFRSNIDSKAKVKVNQPALEHYVQNECEYARVYKIRSTNNNNSSNLNITNITTNL